MDSSGRKLTDNKNSGLGIRKTELVNEALLGKWQLRFIQDRGALWLNKYGYAYANGK